MTAINGFAFLVWVMWIGYGWMGGKFKKLMPNHPILARILGMFAGFVSGSIFSVIFHAIYRM